MHNTTAVCRVARFLVAKYGRLLSIRDVRQGQYDAISCVGLCVCLFRSIVTMAVSVAVSEILAPKSGVTLKTGLGFFQGHRKWHHLIDRIRVPIPLCNYGRIFSDFGDIQRQRMA